MDLNPAYSSSVTSYAAVTGNAQDTVAVTPTSAGATVDITLNSSTPVNNGDSVTWEKGANTLTIVVTNDTEHTTYTVTVECPDTSLASLVIGDLTLDPTFDSDVVTYDALATNDTDTVTATATDNTATVTIELDGTEVTGGSVTWATGDNELVITVSKQGVSTVYTVSVTK